MVELWVLGISCTLIVVLLVVILIYLLVSRRGSDRIDRLVAYVEADQMQEIAKASAKQERIDLRKEQLEVFKQTKEQLKQSLKSKINQKQWKSLESVLESADKGGIGIYVLYNETKNKYYVGQAKQIFKRVRDHFKIEDIARDHVAGDSIKVKFLTANEIGGDYRMDHIEKTGIEIFQSGVNGYNKTAGNL